MSDIYSKTQALFAIRELVNSNPDPAIALADEHGLEHKSRDEYITLGDYANDARYVYPARNALIRRIIDHQIGTAEE